MPNDPPELMTCMEVWGGNEPVDNSVAMAGIDAWVYCRPYAGSSSTAAESGGDVYFVSSCATGRITRLLVADVSGHGSAVGEVAGALRTLMRKYVNYLDPRRFVMEMNRRFTELSQAGNFATAIVTTFFSPTNHVTFCNAGHPPPLMYSETTGWTYLDTQRMAGDSPFDLPLGIEDSADYQQIEAKLKVGDLVLCYTDGLPESRRPDGDFLGQDGLLEIVKTIPVAEPQKIVPALLAAIASQYEGNLKADDITVLLFRSNGSNGRVSFVNRFLVPFRLGWALVKAAFPHGGPAPWPDHHPANMVGAYIPWFNRLWGGKPVEKRAD